MDRNKLWLKNEDEYLKVFYLEKSIEELIKDLHNINDKTVRTEISIVNRAYKLNLYKTQKKDLKFLKEIVTDYIKLNKYTLDEISKKTNVSISLINKFFELNKKPSLKHYEELEGKYYRNENDILNELNAEYKIKDLKGWELEQIKKK